MRVLIATDGSDSAKTAVRAAVRILNPDDRHLDVLCVMPVWNRNDETGRRKRYEERTCRETAKILEDAKAAIRQDAVDVRRVSETGSPALGTVFRSESGLGPVASRVVQHALGPVLVGRAMRREEGLRILIAVDGSAASLHAVETVGELCDLASTEVCLMYVAETPWIQLALEGDWASASEEEIESSEAGVFEKELVNEGEALIEDARKLLRHERLLVNSRIEEGNPANEILAEAERGQYDLVVLGSTGNRDLKHQMLGSVSLRIAWEAPCSVLIVTEPGETG
jgi:nucleotide-binding universal stress UspA family protein